MTDVQHAAPSRLDARGAEAVIDERARAVFAGLAPRVTAAAAAPEAGNLQQRLRAAALSTMPVVLTGAIR